MAALLSVLLAWLGSIYEPRRMVTLSLFWLVGLAAAALFVAATALFLTNLAYRAAPRRLRGVSGVVFGRWPEDAPDSSVERVILVLAPTGGLSVNSLVSILHREAASVSDDYDRFAGFGVVVSINQGHRPEVVVFYEVAGTGEIWQKVRARDAATLQSLVIRAGSSYADLAHWRRATGV